MQKLLKKYNLPSDYAFVAHYQDGKSVVDIIQKESKRFQADVVIMSAKGSSKIASLFIGSAINEIVTSNPFNTLYILKEQVKF